MSTKPKGGGLGAGTRAIVARHLPVAISHAIQTYRQVDMPRITSVKEFVEYHTAGKVAAAHIELLLKLAAWTWDPAEDDDAAATAGLLLDADRELQKYKADWGDDA